MALVGSVDGGVLGLFVGLPLAYQTCRAGTSLAEPLQATRHGTMAWTLHSALAFGG